VYSAIEHVANELLRNHKNILKGVYQVMHKEVPSKLERFTSDFLIDSDEDPIYTIDLNSFELNIDVLKASVEGLPHYKRVAKVYISDRYLAHVSKKQLLSRGNDIFRNLTQLNNRGQITLENEDPRTMYWQDLFSEFLQECLIRGIEQDEFRPVVAEDFPIRGGDERPKVIGRLMQRISLPDTPYIVKFGKVEHIKELYKRGRIRIAPASEYEDPSLNSARNDNELSIQFEIDVTAIPVMGPGARKNRKRHIPLKMDLNSDYYVLCFSERLRQRLFMDYDADACLIIKQPDVFQYFARTHRIQPSHRDLLITHYLL